MAPAELTPEFAFLLEREEVVTEFKDDLKKHGITTIAKFAALVETQAEFRDMLRDDFKLDSKGGTLETKAKVASILVAWTSAKARSEKRAEHEGEAEARNEAKKIPVGDHLAMKSTFESKFWALEDNGVPCKTYMERILDRIEKCDLKAELLSEVLSINDEGEDTLKPVWDASLTLKAVRVQQRVALPHNPEQLRRRLKVMGTAWAMCSFTHGSQSYLKNYDMHVWAEFPDYLLGELVLGMVQDDLGAEVNYRDWEILLNFEHQVRREMTKKMMTKGMEMHQALREAMVDPLTRDRHLVVPLQKRNLKGQRAGTRAQEEPPYKKTRRDGGDHPPPPPPHKIKRNRGRGGGGKGKGKGALSQSSTGCATVAPDGGRICYAFNNRAEGCARQGCKYAHVCGVCFAKGRPMYDCDHRRAAGG